jgi:hypothetical protein
MSGNRSINRIAPFFMISRPMADANGWADDTMV